MIMMYNIGKTAYILLKDLKKIKLLCSIFMIFFLVIVCFILILSNSKSLVLFFIEKNVKSSFFPLATVFFNSQYFVAHGSILHLMVLKGMKQKVW